MGQTTLILSMDPEPEFVPHVGKKKKKKKRGKKSNDAPEYDPHLENVSTSNDHEKKRRSKRKRSTMFEPEDAAPDVQMYEPSNNNNSTYMGSGKKKTNVSAQKDGKSTKTRKRSRKPKGTRTAVRRSSGPRNNAQKVAMWEDHEKQYNKITETTRVLEDESNDDDEDDEKKENEDMNEWNDEDMDDMEEDVFSDDDDRFTPITLRKRPKYGKHGVFEQSEMLNVFKENEDNKKNFIFLQIPPILPLVSHLNENEKRDLAKNKNVKQGLLRQAGEGQIGTIRIRKSGKAEFVIGDLTMDIGFSAPIDCYQQIMHIHCENSMDGSYKGKSQFLGSVPPQNNLVCSYRAKDLLKK